MDNFLTKRNKGKYKGKPSSESQLILWTDQGLTGDLHLISNQGPLFIYTSEQTENHQLDSKSINYVYNQILDLMTFIVSAVEVANNHCAGQWKLVRYPWLDTLAILCFCYRLMVFYQIVYQIFANNIAVFTAEASTDEDRTPSWRTQE